MTGDYGVRTTLGACLSGLLLIGSVAGCGSGPSKSRSPADLAIHLPPVDSRDVPYLPAAATTDGNLRLTPLAAECGITYLIGTHAEIDFKGQLCRLRLAVQNVDNGFHTFDTTAQRLVDTTGKASPPDLQAMNVKRQDQQPILGAGDVLVMTLYFGLPDDHVPASFVLHGDNDPSGIATSATARHAPHGVTVAIPPRARYTPKPIF